MADHQHGFALRNDPPPRAGRTYVVEVQCTIRVEIEAIDGDDACARAEDEIAKDLKFRYGKGCSADSSAVQW